MSVRVEEAEHFHEEDEDPKQIFATFDAAEKERTAPPDTRHDAHWQIRLRFALADVLHRLARLIEPSRVRQR